MEPTKLEKQRKQVEHSWFMTASLVFIASILLAWVLHYTQAIMIPFVLSIFIVSLAAPLVDWQVIRLQFPRPLAVTIALLVVLTLFVVLVMVLGHVVQNVIHTSSQYTDRFTGFAEDLLGKIQTRGVDIDKEGLIADLQKRIPQVVSSLSGTAFGFLSGLSLVVIFVIFLLAGRNPHVVRKGVYAEVDIKIRRYIGTKVMLSAATGILVWLLLWAIGLEMAFVFGVMAFLLNFIPTLGSIIATLLPLPIAFAQYESPMMIILTLALPGVVQVMIGNVLEPKIMGKGLELHPVAILIALSIWSLLWGIPGALLAVPMTAILRLVLMQFETLRPMGNLLAGRLPGFEEE